MNKFNEFSTWNSNSGQNPIHKRYDDTGQSYGVNLNQANTSLYSRISDLTAESNSTNLLGLIISKEGPRSFLSKKGNCSERHLISFTIRDDEIYFINITCWGGQEFVSRLSNDFHIGHIVEIKGAQVQAKSKNPSDEKFKPWTPSPFCLNLTENHGEFNFNDNMEAQNLLNLLYLPTRESNDFYTLEDIEANGMNLNSEHINIFALIKKIWPLKEIVTKSGKQSVKADVVLCDDTCSSFHLTLWDSYAYLVNDWKPMDTVIFAVDVRVSYSEFRSSMAACTDSKTIITVNPDIPEAISLIEYGKSNLANCTPSDMMNLQESNKDPEISSINNVIIIRELKELQEDLSVSGLNGYGVLFAFLSHFDIDTEDKTLLRNACKSCHRKIDINANPVCSTPNCTSTQLSPFERTVLEYSVMITLTDASGSLETCYVSSTAMEQFLKISPSEFQCTEPIIKNELKWQFLFERMRAVVKISGYSNGNRTKGNVKVMSLERAAYSDVL